MINKAKCWFYKIKMKKLFVKSIFKKDEQTRTHKVSSLRPSSWPQSLHVQPPAIISLALCELKGHMWKYSLNEQSTQLIRWPYSICWHSYRFCCVSGLSNNGSGFCASGSWRAGFATYMRIKRANGMLSAWNGKRVEVKLLGGGGVGGRTVLTWEAKQAEDKPETCITILSRAGSALSCSWGMWMNAAVQVGFGYWRALRGYRKSFCCAVGGIFFGFLYFPFFFCRFIIIPFLVLLHVRDHKPPHSVQAPLYNAGPLTHPISRCVDQK